MERFILTDSLLTGVSWQDRQHKELIKRVNRLIEAIEQGKGMAELERLFTFLDEYMVIHFEAEEVAMHNHDYPDTVAHLREHTMFIEDLAGLREGMEHFAQEELEAKAERLLVDWLRNHIGRVDKKLGLFLKGGR